MKQRTIGAALLAAVLLVSCATSGDMRKSEKEIMGTLRVWEDGILSRDIEQILSVYSEAYSDQRSASKQALRRITVTALERGMYDDGEITFDDMRIEFAEGGVSATAGPILLETAAGYVVGDFVLRKQDGAWFIVGAEVY